MLGRIFAIVGGLLVVALFAALLAPYFIDWTDFRRDFETQASRIIGKKVVVHGKVDARLLPFPTVTMTDVRVGEDSDGGALVTADSFSMETELAPFLSGEALIYNMRIVHPRVKLRLTEDGTLDWVKTGKPQIPASTVVLESVTIDDGEILYIDEQTGRDRHITGLGLKLSAKTLAGPWRVAGSGAIDGRAGNFVLSTSTPQDDKVFLKLRLLPDDPGIVAEMEGLLGLQDLRPQYSGTFRLREKFRSEKSADQIADDSQESAAPRISGEFALQNDNLRIPKYEFKMGDPVDPYVITGEATLDAGRDPKFLLTATGQQIDMSRFGTSVEGKQKAIPLRDRVRAAMTLAADIPIPQMPGRATISLPALLADDTVIRDIKLDMIPAVDGWRIEQAEAHLPGRTTLSAKGKLTVIGSQAFEGNLLLASNQPTGFAEWVTGSVPDTVRKLKSAGFSADVSLTTDLQRFENLEIAFGDTELKGRLEHSTPEDMAPTLSTELEGNSFDLDTVMALGGLMTGESSVNSMFGHNVSARLKFDSFQAFGLEAGKLETTFALGDDAITGARLSIGDFYGAALKAEVSVSNIMEMARGTAHLDIQAPDATGLTRLLADRLPAHPVWARLASSAAYYADSDLQLDLRLGEGDWPIEADLAGSANGSRIIAKLAAQSLDLNNSGGLTLDASIENPEAWKLLGQAGLSTIPIDAAGDGMLKLRVDQSADSEPQVELSFVSGTTTATVEGQAALDAANFLDGSYAISVDSGDIAPYFVITGVGLPRLAEGLPLAATANVYTTPEAVSIENIEGSSNDNAFKGNLSVDRANASPVFAGELDLDSVNLLWFAEAIYGEVVDPLSFGLSTRNISTSGGLPVSTDIALRASVLRLGALGNVDSFTGTLKASPGRISLDDATGLFSTGRFKAAVEFGNTEGNGFFRSRLGVEGAQMKTAFWQYAGQPVASARADLSAVLDATGTSPMEMLESATGSGKLDLAGLDIRGLNRDALTPMLAAADALKGEINETSIKPVIDDALFAGSSEFPTLAIPFAITGAKLRADKVIGTTDALRIDADGTLSLKDGTLDAGVEATFLPGEQAVAGAEPGIRLEWKGPFNSPARTVDLTQMTSYLSLRKFEQERRKVEILQARMAEKQRLRREAALYRALQAERERLKQKALDEARLLKEAQQKRAEMARQEAEERAKAKAKAEAERQAADPAPDSNEVLPAQ